MKPDLEQRVYTILAKKQRGEKLSRKEDQILAYSWYKARSCRACIERGV
jgi:hypothetical protein